MAHEVRFSIPERRLGRSDIVFHVKKDGRKFGTLTISKGSLVWFPKNVKYGYKVGWAKFDEFMQQRSRFERR